MGRKKKEIELSFEEKQELRIKEELKRLKEDYEYVPKPTYFYNVGDKVIIGNLKDCIIYNIIENGKFYVVDYTGVNYNYGNTIETEHCKSVWMWTDIRKQNNNTNSFIKNNDIDIYYSNRRIDGLLNHAYHFGFDFSPEYQRGNVWTLENKIDLIDSIFNNIDIGKFTFIKPDYILDKTEVLDGKQRITTLMEYFEDRFEYKGCKFSDLSIKDKQHFENYSISWGESTGLTREQKLRYFIKLNTTGKKMDEKHIEYVRQLLKVSE